MICFDPQYDLKGIYQIRNEVNGRRYVGMTRDSFFRRWTYHMNNLKAGVHSNGLMQNEFLMYGIDAFYFSVLEVMPNITRIEQREKYWIVKFSKKHELYNVIHNPKREKYWRSIDRS